MTDNKCADELRNMALRIDNDGTPSQIVGADELRDLAARIDALSRRPAATSEAVSGDYVLVPREPTEAMLDAAWWNGPDVERIAATRSPRDRAKLMYRAMLAAAPASPDRHGVLGPAVRLAECPPGLFYFNGTLCFRSEYATTTDTNPNQPDAYVVESGEYFWGGCTTSIDRDDLMVRPVLPPTQSGDAK